MGYKIESMVGEGRTAPEEMGYMLALIPEYGAVLEIGTLDGVTVAWWASRRQRATFLSVDPFIAACGTWAGDSERWKKNSRPNQKLFVGNSNGLLGSEQSFDLIFVDGDHSYTACLLDLENIKLMLRPNGHICVHDYGHGHKDPKHGLAGVTQAVDEFCSKNDYQINEVVRTTAVLRKKV